MSSSSDRIERRADPNYREQWSLRLPMRLIVSLDKLARLEKSQDPSTPMPTRTQLLERAIGAFLDEHPLKEQLDLEVDAHFVEQHRYVMRHAEIDPSNTDK